MRRFLFAALLGFWGAAAQAAPPGGALLQLAKTIPLQEVVGRLDHLTADAAGQRLYVSARANGSVEVLNLRGSGHWLQRIGGCNSPQGVAFIPETGALFVANGDSGVVRIYQAGFFPVIGTVDLHGDADNLLYDQVHSEVYVGFGSGAVAAIGVHPPMPVVVLPLSAHPEGIQAERDGGRVFVNVPDAQHVAVINRRNGGAVTGWSTGEVKGNYPLALDEKNRRLLVGCREPASILVFDIDRGSVVATAPIAGDVDDLFYDAKRERIYAICGAGVIDIVKQDGPDLYHSAGKIETGPGARTGLFISELDLLCVAVPRRGQLAAEVRCYSSR